MRVRNSSQGYGTIAMALHWIVVLLVLGAWLTGQFGDELPRGAPRETGLFFHMSLGLTVVAFVIARLFWRLSDPPPAAEKSPLGAWGEWAGKAVHYFIYVALIAVPVAGIVVQFAQGHALPIFGLFEIASPWRPDRALAHDVKEVHEVLANGMMALIGLHAAAALAHHYIFRNRTLLRMLPFTRSQPFASSQEL
jgi:cytochrome b561